MSWAKYFLSERMLESSGDYSSLLAFERQAQQWKEEENKMRAKFAIDSKMFEGKITTIVTMITHT